MFWSRKKKESKDPPSQVPSSQAQADGASVPPPIEQAAQQIAHPPVTRELEQSATAIEQLVDLDEISSPSAQTIAPENVIEPPPLPIDAERERAAPQQPRVTQMSAQSAQLGDLVRLLLSSKHYRHYTLADLEWLVLPAMQLGQVAIANAQEKTSGVTLPAAAVLWARVSDDVDQRLANNLEQPVRLRPDEWNSGENLWVIATAGDPRLIRPVLDVLMQRSWAGRTARMRARRRDGQVGVVKVAPNT